MGYLLISLIPISFFVYMTYTKSKDITVLRRKIKNQEQIIHQANVKEKKAREENTKNKNIITKLKSSHEKQCNKKNQQIKVLEKKLKKLEEKNNKNSNAKIKILPQLGKTTSIEKKTIPSDDILGTFHEQTNAVNSILDLQHYLLQYFDYENNRYNKDTLLDKIHLAVDTLCLRIVDTAEKLNDNKSSENIKASSILNKKLKKLYSYKKHYSSVSIHEYRKISQDILEIINNYSKNSEIILNRSTIKEFKYSAKELQRLICIYDVLIINSRTKKLNTEMLNAISQGSYGTSDKLDLVKTIKNIINSYIPLASSNNIKINYKYNRNSIVIRIDKANLEKAIGNLIDNAIKYTGILPEESKFQHTWIDVEINSYPDKNKISIESWGIPITKREHEEKFIFLEGIRGKHAMINDVRGTGSGLADVKKFTEANNGELIYDTIPVDNNSTDSKPTKTTVSIILPTT